ncbi:MAG TPA: hypothetical protein VH000_10680 [Rhizomicrobium sp.]|jgi:ribose/xylose/arabinose/galactoside ABC-type transport system permease subunit|nr:hypothetical protein [Rhizomicrobium sp.]
MSDPLDTQLSHPLDEVTDAGFSASVVARVTAIRIRRARIEAVVLLGALAALLAVLPFTSFGHAVEKMSSTLANSSTIALVFGAAVLSLLAVRFALD